MKTFLNPTTLLSYTLLKVPLSKRDKYAQNRYQSTDVRHRQTVACCRMSVVCLTSPNHRITESTHYLSPMIPLGDDNSARVLTPYINYILIAANVFVFIYFQRLGTDD